MLASALAGCAGAPQNGAIEQTAAVEPGDNDPAEPVNRAVFDANMTADRAVMKPIAQAYQDYIPADIRRGVRNASANLREPVVAANDLLQGHPARALTSAERLGINTTAGYAGVVDRAAQWNLPPHSADFGQTLAVWGVPEGPFVELPALGPSNVRDAVGSAVGIALDPLSWTGNPASSYLGYARTSAEFVDTRTEHLTDLDELERNSLDFYAALRSVYRQHRQAEIDKARHDTDPSGRARDADSTPNRWPPGGIAVSASPGSSPRCSTSPAVDIPGTRPIWSKTRTQRGRWMPAKRLLKIRPARSFHGHST